MREFESFDVLLDKSIAAIITAAGNIEICKVEFRVAGTKESRRASGNRCIVAIHKGTNKVNVLLVYHKNHLGGGNETAKWKQIIKENYTEYTNIL